jgi:hypothetical protein
MDAGVALGFIKERYVISSATNTMIHEWMYPHQIHNCEFPVQMNAEVLDPTGKLA